MRFLIFNIIFGFIVFCFQNGAISSEAEPFKISKFITAYDFNDAHIPFISPHFEIMNTNLNKAMQVQKIKSINPSFRAIFYDNALTHKEGATGDWYIRDAKTGSRLVNKDWGWYLMDIGNPLYRKSLSNYIKKCSDDNPQFDGVFLDDVWGSVSSDRFFREGTKEAASLPLHVTKYWRDNMKLLLIQIKMAIGRKLLIINTGAFNTDYLALADGQMYEAFCHATWQTFGEYYPDWQKVIERMITVSASGKIFFARSGILGETTDSQIKKTARYCFTMFLLGANSNSFFYFSKSTRGVTYFPEWDIDLGAPGEDYHARTGTSIFQREFSKGLVLINPSSESVQVNLGTRYKTLDGAFTDTIRMEDHQGEILLKVFKDTTHPTPQID